MLLLSIESKMFVSFLVSSVRRECYLNGLAAAADAKDKGHHIRSGPDTFLVFERPKGI